MALFQPSNVIPSTFAGVGESTIDVSSNVNISWQVNGNSPMTAFQIKIFDNASTSATAVHDTGIITSYSALPFNGVDNKGNPQQFSYAPTSTTWASWGLSNGNEYKIEITQWWGSDTTAQSTTKVTQWSGSVFYTSETPIVSIVGATNQTMDLATAQATITADYTPKTDAVQAVRWQIGRYGQSATAPTITSDSEVEILDDTGFINTNVLSYTYDGFFSDTDDTVDPPLYNYYAVRCTIETDKNVLVNSGWVSLKITYDSAVNTSDLTVQCMPDDCNLLTWNMATNIEGTISSGDIDIDRNGYLHLGSNQNATWDEVDGESMNLPAPYSLAWKGKLGSIITKDYQITTAPTITTDTQTIHKSQSDFTLNEIEFSNINNTNTFNDGNREIVYCDTLQKFFSIDKYGKFCSSVDGSSWQFLFSFDGSGFHLAYGNGYFVIISQTTLWILRANNEFDIIWSYTGGNVYCSVCYYNGTISGYPNAIPFMIGQNIETSSLSRGIFSFVNAVNGGFIGGDITYNKKTYNDIPLSAFFVNNKTILHCGKTIRLKNMSSTNILLDLSNRDGVIDSLIYGNGIYAALASNRIFISSDTTNWQEINTPNSRICYSLSFNAGYFLLVSNSPSNPYYYSFDCQNWQVFTYNPSYAIISKWSSMEFIAYNPTNGRWVNISGNSDLSVSFQVFYSTIATKSISGNWLNSWEYSSQSSIRNVSVNSNHTQGTVTATVETYEPSLDITLTYTLYSDTSTAANTTFNFTQGTIAAIKEVSRTTGLSATISDTASTITFSGISIPTPNAQATTTVVNVKLAVIYNNLISGGTSGQDIVVLDSTDNTNVYHITLYDNFASAFSYGLKLSKNGTDRGTSEVEPFIPSIGSYDILGKVFITPNKMILVLYGEEVQGSTVSNSSDITYTQDNITSVKLMGAQVVDYLYIQKGNTDFESDFTPSWVENTLFFAKFDNAEDKLQAGTVSKTGQYQNAIYRLEAGNTLKPVATLGTNITQLKDYGIKSQQAYNYELFYLGTTEGYTAPLESDQICKPFRAYSLIEATQKAEEIDEYPNLYHVVKVWRFGNNISAGSISNNNSPNWLTNFTQYRLRQPSSRLGESGTLQALLANYNQSENFYEDTAAMMQELKQASVSKNTFFLKDMKGNLYMVGISAPITQTINTKTRVQEVTISVPWEETGDATNVSLIQTPEDSGWQGNN